MIQPFVIVNRTTGNYVVDKNGDVVSTMCRTALERVLACSTALPVDWIDTSTGQSPVASDLEIVIAPGTI